MSQRSGAAWLLPLGASLAPPIVLSSWWWGWSDPATRLSWLGWLLYWWMPLTLVYAGLCAVWRLRAREASVASLARAWWPGAALALVGLAAVFFASPPGLRVQFDETCLVGVSQNMHAQGHAVLTTGAIPFEGRPFPLENMVDKRPPLFAYLCSLVHEVAGYQVSNAFVVNGALLFVGLFAAFAAARARLGLLAGLAAPLLLLAVPLTGVVATSAGFELLAVVLLLLATLAALDFVARPDAPRLAALAGSSALLVQSRYESLPAAALLLLLAFSAVRGRLRCSAQARWLLAALPALAAPLLLLLDHASDPNFTPEAAGRALLSVGHFFDHVSAFGAGMFAPGLDNPLPGLVAALAVVAVALRLRARQATRRDLLVALPPVSITVVVLAWFYGDAADPTAMRLFLPFSWLCALTPLALVRALPNRGPQLVLLTAAVLAPMRLGELSAGRAFPILDMAALTDALDGVVRRLPGAPGRTLWIGAGAQHLIVNGHAAVSVRTFERLGPRVEQLRRQGDLGALYLIETPIDRDMAPALGAPRDLLRRYPSEVVQRVGGKMPVTVHRLGR